MRVGQTFVPTLTVGILVLVSPQHCSACPGSGILPIPNIIIITGDLLTPCLLLPFRPDKTCACLSSLSATCLPVYMYVILYYTLSMVFFLTWFIYGFQDKCGWNDFRIDSSRGKEKKKKKEWKRRWPRKNRPVLPQDPSPSHMLTCTFLTYVYVSCNIYHFGGGGRPGGRQEKEKEEGRKEEKAASIRSSQFNWLTSTAHTCSSFPLFERGGWLFQREAGRQLWAGGRGGRQWRQWQAVGQAVAGSGIWGGWVGVGQWAWVTVLLSHHGVSISISPLLF